MNPKRTKSCGHKLRSHYEYLVPAYFALLLLKDEGVKDFKLKLNSRKFGKFGDLIIETKYKNRAENVAIHLQYIEASSETDVCQKDKDFEIKQYKNAYDKLDPQIQKDYKFMLFTNARFKNIMAPKIFFKQKDTTCKTYLFNEDFEEEESKRGNVFYKGFVLFSEQKKCSDLRENIKTQFCKDFYCDKNIANIFISLFEELKKFVYKSNEIHKKLLLIKITDLLLCPDYTLNSPVKQKHHLRAQLIKQALGKFDITICNHLPKTKFDLPDYLDKCDSSEPDKLIDSSISHKINYFDAIINGNDLGKLSSFFSEGLLFVEINNKSVQTIISLLNITKTVESFDIKFVLIDEKNILEKSRIKSGNIFENLDKLKEIDKICYENLTEHFKISLQGRPSTSLTVLQTIYDVSLDQFITPNILFQCLGSDFVIGTKIEPLPEHYIGRSLTPSTVSYLQNLCLKEQKCIVHCGDQLEDFKLYLKKKNFCFPIIVTEDNCENALESSTLYLSEKKECNDCFTHLKLPKNKDPYWRMFTINLNNPEIFNHNLNVIYGKPGSGKTTIMKYLANYCPLNFWVIWVSLKESSLNLENGKSEFCLEDFWKSEDTLSSQVIQLMNENKKLMFFFDDLDKLPNEHIIIKTAKSIKNLSRSGYVCCIACSKRLENILQQIITADYVFYNEDLEVEEQRTYITKSISNKNMTKIDIDFICRKVTELELDILKIPVFLQTLINLINKSKNFKTFVNDFLNITVICSEFVDEHLKRTLSSSNNNFEKMFIGWYIEECQIGALKTCLDPEDFKVLNIKSRQMFLDQIKQQGDVFELILEINSEDSLVFVHHFLAEYFAALWLNDNFKNISREQKKIIFKPQYKKIQNFLDFLLAQNCPLHLAICNRKFERVVEIAEKHLNDLDDAGRNPLHIASSLGIKHSFSTSTNTFRKKCEIGSNRETKIFEHLLSKIKSGYILEKDTIFDMNCFQFADASLSLSFLEELSKKDELRLEYLDNFKNLKTLSEACVKYGYITILKKVFEWKKLEDLESKDMPFLHLALDYGQEEVVLFLLEQETNFRKVNCFEKTPLHVAANSNYKKIVERLLNLGVDTEATDLNGKTPLHLAAEKGYKDIVECLVTSGAKIDAKDKNNKTALHEASSLGEVEVVRFLIENGADVNSSDANQETPILSASISGQIETVKCLIEKGANIQAFDKNQRTVLHYAAIKNDVFFVKYLIEKNVNISARDTNGQTAVQLAEKHSHNDIVEVLKSAAEN